jgi:hypothetical protein
MRLGFKQRPMATALSRLKAGAGGGSPLEKEQWFWLSIPPNGDQGDPPA